MKSFKYTFDWILMNWRIGQSECDLEKEFIEWKYFEHIFFFFLDVFYRPIETTVKIIIWSKSLVRLIDQQFLFLWMLYNQQQKKIHWLLSNYILLCYLRFEPNICALCKCFYHFCLCYRFFKHIFELIFIIYILFTTSSPSFFFSVVISIHTFLLE